MGNGSQSATERIGALTATASHAGSRPYSNGTRIAARSAWSKGNWYATYNHRIYVSQQNHLLLVEWKKALACKFLFCYPHQYQNFLHERETLPLMLKATLSFNGSCPKHPRYDPARDGENGIRGACAGCYSLFNIFKTISNLTPEGAQVSFGKARRKVEISPEERARRADWARQLGLKKK